MKSPELFLILGIVFIILAVVLSLVASMRVSVHGVRELDVDTSEPELLVSGNLGFGGVNVTRLIIDNKGLTRANMSISCSNKLIESITIDAYDKFDLSNSDLTAPCWLIPGNYVSLHVRVEYVYVEMPYTYLSFISFLCMVLSLGLIFMYTYIRVLERVSGRIK